MCCIIFQISLCLKFSGISLKGRKEYSKFPGDHPVDVDPLRVLVTRPRPLGELLHHEDCLVKIELLLLDEGTLLDAERRPRAVHVRQNVVEGSLHPLLKR